MNMQKIRKDNILGSRRFSNYSWGIIIFLGGLGFLLAGISSYLKINLLPFADSSELIFIPQGVIMIFYGTIGLALSGFLWTTIIFNVGGGYNEFNGLDKKISIVRLGFPGKHRRININYAFSEIRSIKISISEGLNPKREIYLCTKNNQEIPLTRVGQPLLLSEIEEQATELANLINVKLENK